MSDNLKLDMAISKVTVRFLAENLELPDAETLLKGLRETSMFLERRISRERLLLRKPTVSSIVATETIVVS